MHIGYYLARQLADERVADLRAGALPRRTRRGFRLGLRRLRAVKRRPFVTPRPRAAR
jgi:hypothetical protein